MPSESTFDLAVVGAGMGGLATAALAQRLSLRTILFESHTRLGGCAGYFPRGPYTFDAGATALMGLEPGEPIGGLLRVLELEFTAVQTPSYRIHLPDRTLDLASDENAFERSLNTAFPGLELAQRTFWRWQSALGERLFQAASGVPRLPLRSLGDVVHNVNLLRSVGVLAGLTSALTVADVLRLLGLSDNVPFRALVAMLLQDTAQAGPETVPFANAAACLQAYRRGLSRPGGGMRTLVEGIGQRFTALGGELRTGALVDGIEPAGAAGYRIITRRRGRSVLARQVALNLPLDRAAALLGRTLERPLAGQERRSRAVWSACTAYLAIDRAAVPDDTPLFHQVLQDYDRPIHDGNNVLVSLSPIDDPGYGPPDVRVATLSTHTSPADWSDLGADRYEASKHIMQTRLLAALARALPDAPAHLRHAEFGSPRSFARYTRRTLGAVGGPPVGRGNSNALAVGSDAFGPDLWVIGDSVFPGQGTMAIVLSGIRVIERITGCSWREVQARFAGPCAGGHDVALPRMIVSEPPVEPRIREESATDA